MSCRMHIALPQDISESLRLEIISCTMRGIQQSAATTAAALDRPSSAGSDRGEAVAPPCGVHAPLRVPPALPDHNCFAEVRTLIACA